MEGRMTRVVIYSLLTGFLANSVLQRVTKAIPADDIFYPLVLLGGTAVLLALRLCVRIPHT